MNSETECWLFTDGSVNTISKVGVGAVLWIKDLNEKVNPEEIQTKKFENTSSTKLELQTLIWALETSELKASKITVYTDSQNIVGLMGRRVRLEKNNFISKNGKELKNKKLYQKFYLLSDSLNLEILKIKGHKASCKKNKLDLIFTQVDKAARKVLRT